jgi:hypothetical protein
MYNRHINCLSFYEQFNAQENAVMIIFLVGFLIGGFLGITLMAILAFGKREDNLHINY